MNEFNCSIKCSLYLNFFLLPVSRDVAFYFYIFTFTPYICKRRYLYFIHWNNMIITFACKKHLTITNSDQDNSAVYLL